MTFAALFVSKKRDRFPIRDKVTFWYFSSRKSTLRPCRDRKEKRAERKKSALAERIFYYYQFI